MPVNPIPNFIVKIYPGKTKVTVKPGPVTITNHYGDIWANITGKPTTFPPSAHRHPASEIDGLSVIVGPKGDKGEKGDTGERGLPGVDGVIGVNGAPGAKGDKGDTGSQGLPGERGLQGVQGDIGPQGIQGNQGVQGEKGDTGSTGSQGLQGVPGLKGDTGEKGDKGDIGERGLQGIQGIQGVKGDKGDTGNDGVSVTGPQGIQGIQGIQGDTGPAGATGLQGIQGVKGDTGERGLQGLQGIQGETGLQGLKGDKGDTGLTGLKGDKGDTGERGLQGDQGFQGERGLQGLPGNNGTDGLKGDKGDTGERGLQGDQGVQGVPGVAGAVGAKGDKGDTGERGLQGDQGLQGERGLQGLQGNNGTTGLKGDTGDTGERGLQGEQGIQGIAGNNGTTGLKGDKGDTGERGLQGEQGIQGIQGVKGDTGETGPQGPAGNSTGGGTADYVAWANVTGKPTTFAPSAHGHVISAITGLQTALDAKISTTTADGKYSLLTHQHQWTEILSKPTTFSPSNHTHNTTDITGISNYMLTSTATASFKPISYAPQWTEVLNKPTAFTPDTHTHEYSAIANKPSSFTPPIATTSVLGGVRALYNGNITIDSSGYINANIPTNGLTTTEADAKYVIANATTNSLPFIRRSAGFGGTACMTLNNFGSLYTQLSYAGASTLITQTSTCCTLTGITNWVDDSILTLGKALSTFALVGSGSGGGNTTVTWTTLSGKPSTFTPPIATTDILGGVMVGAGLTVDSYGTLSATPNWANITSKPSTFTPPVANLTVLGGIKPGYGVTVSSDGTLDVTVSGNGGTATTIAWANITGKPTTFAPTIANSTTVGGIRPGIGLTVSANGTLDCTVTGNGGSTATWDTLANKPDTFNPPVASASLLGGVKPIGNITVDYSGQIDVMIPATLNWSTLTGKPSTFAPPIATGSILGGVKVGTGLSVASDGTLNAAGSTASVLTSASGNALAILDRTGSSLLYTHSFNDATGAVSMIDDGDHLTQMTLGSRTLTASGITTWSDNSLLTRAYADARYSSATSVDWVNVANKPAATANQVLTYNGSLWIAANHTNCLTTTNGNISTTVTTDGLTLTKVMANASEIVVPAIKVNDNLYRTDGKRNVDLTWNHGLGSNHATSLTLGDTYARIKAATGLNAGPDPGDTACYPNGFALSVHDYSHPYDITTKYWADLKYAPITVTNYSLPIATSSTLGGIKVGDNLTISNGVLSASGGGVTGFNSRTGNVSLTSSDVTSALTYTPLTSTTAYSNLSFTGTSSSSPFNFKVQNANGSKSITMQSVTAGTSDIFLTTSNTRANGQTDTYYPFIRLYTDPVYPDINEGRLLLQYNYTVNASTGPYYNTSIQISKTKAEFFAQTYTWTDNSLITRVYADSRYLTSANMSAYLTTSSAASTYLPSANFTYANLTGTPTLASVAISGSYTDLSNTPASYSLPTASTTVLGGVKVDGSTITIASGVISAVSSSYTLPMASASTLGGVRIGSGISVDQGNGFLNTDVRLTTNTFTGTQNLQDNELIRAKIRDYSETISSPTISAGTLVLNLENSNIFTVALNAAITTLTISNPPASGSGGSFTLIFTADGTPRAVTWPASIKWAGGTAPTITSAIGKVDSFAFFTSDGGTTWQGYVGGQNF